MKDLGRVRRNALRMMRKFPSRQVTLLRPETDAYGQPTGEASELGTFECWTEAIARPTKYDIDALGQRYEDEGARWVCLIWAPDLPQAKHGDLVRFADGETGVIRNVYNPLGVRVHWQVGDRDGL